MPIELLKPQNHIAITNINLKPRVTWPNENIIGAYDGDEIWFKDGRESILKVLGICNILMEMIDRIEAEND